VCACVLVVRPLTFSARITGIADDNIHQLLGELQFAYIGFYVGESYECFEQWKELIMLVALCQDAFGDAQYYELFYNFLRIFHYQLKAAPSDFFCEFTDANFLVHCIKVRANAASVDSVGAVLQRD
jgi:hypothetical protein